MGNFEQKKTGGLRAKLLKLKDAFAALPAKKKAMVAAAAAFALAALILVIVLLSSIRKPVPQPEKQEPAAAPETFAAETEPARETETPPRTEAPETEPSEAAQTETEPSEAAQTETETAETETEETEPAETEPDLTEYYAVLDEIDRKAEACLAQRDTCSVKAEPGKSAYFSGNSLIVLDLAPEGSGATFYADSLSNCSRTVCCDGGDVYWILLTNGITGAKRRLYYREGVLLNWSAEDGVRHISDGDDWLQMQDMQYEAAAACALAQEDWDANAATARIYGEYGRLISEYEKKYGSCAIEARAPYSVRGLCLAELLDFDADGMCELLMAWEDDDVYRLGVWGLKNGSVASLFESGDFDGVEPFFDGSGPLVLSLAEVDGKLCILSQSFDGMPEKRVSYLKNGAFETLTLTVEEADDGEGVYYVESLNGVPVDPDAENTEYEFLNRCYENYARTYFLRRPAAFLTNEDVIAAECGCGESFDAALAAISEKSAAFTFR